MIDSELLYLVCKLNKQLELDMLLVDLKKRCLDKIEEAFVKAEAHYGISISRVPVVFSNSLKKTAGKATYTNHRAPEPYCGVRIKLATKVLELNPEEFIGRTPGHEAAHIIAVELFKQHGVGHGPAWKEVMGVIGQTAEQHHSMETAPTNKAKRVPAFCKCNIPHQITTIRARKMLLGTGTYRCNSCKQPLSLSKSTKEVDIEASVANLQQDATLMAAIDRAADKVLARAADKVLAKRAPTAKKPSNATKVREFVNTHYATQADADKHFDVVFKYAIPLFATKSAARSCCLANIPKVFM